VLRFYQTEADATGEKWDRVTSVSDSGSGICRQLSRLRSRNPGINTDTRKADPLLKGHDRYLGTMDHDGFKLVHGRGRKARPE